MALTSRRIIQIKFRYFRELIKTDIGNTQPEEVDEFASVDKLLPQLLQESGQFHFFSLRVRVLEHRQLVLYHYKYVNYKSCKGSKFY